MMRHAASLLSIGAREGMLALMFLAPCAHAQSPVLPGGPPCLAPSPTPVAPEALARAERGIWTARFRQHDHGARAALRQAYAASQGPLWFAHGRPSRQALALLRIVQDAEAYGLEPADYGAAHLQAQLAAAGCDAGRQRELDLDLSAAAAALVSDLHYGRIDPRAAGFSLGKPRPDDLDLAAALRALASSEDLARTLASFAPPFVHYRLLEQALAQYRALAAADPGDAALALRVRKIDLTLERWRWLPEFHTPPIIVNIPQFRLFAFRTVADRAADILQMDVIVGREFPRTRTPVFAADLTSVIFRPYWDVPRSILLREMLPKIRANPRYLAAQHLQIVSNAAGAAVLPLTPASLAALAAGAARLRQLPGPDNALGLIKFDLPNSHAVYLHSTPAQALFLRARRAFSHGCIRVSNPVALAVYVLRETPGDWTAAKIEAAMHGSETRRVRLARPIRVMVLYGTVLAQEDGEVLFFHDIYGQDRRLERLLGMGPVAVSR